MINVSGFGLGVTIVAVQSFPMGFNLSKFADDQDPLSAKPYEPFGYDLLYDGELFAFDKAAVVEVDVSVVPNTDDDINLKILLQSRRGGISILPFDDSVTMVINYPDGGRVILSSGSILSGPVMDNITQSGRKSGNIYKFVFSSIQGMQTTREALSGIAQGLLGIL